MTTPKTAIAIARPRGAYLAFAAAGLGLVYIAVVLVVIRGALAFMSYVVLACAAVLTLGSISVL